MNIYETLHKEHEKVAQLFEQIEHTSSHAVKTREKLFVELKNALEMHSLAEEKVFYAPLKRNKESHFDALEAVEEHHLLDLLLKELDRMPKGKDEWLAKLCVLKESVLHHVKEEESQLFSKARTFMDDAKAEAMAKQFEDEKAKLH